MAACALDRISTDLGCLPNDPIGFVKEFYPIALGFIGGIALITLILGGYVIMTSHGDPQKVTAGKSYIFYSIMGLMLAIFGYVFIEVIVVDILKVPGFAK